ncbi:MAG TPA: hypothetical protein VHA80_04610 [Solirubrobacterales bacterium]|nr:hypothetical protein [Solirubrobacterales bacterium]
MGHSAAADPIEQRFAPDRLKAAGSISWSPRHDLDAQEWTAAGRRIGAVGRSIQWLLGDWICYGNARFGERYARASKITGYDAQTLMNMVYVASRFAVSRRREELSWSHHEALSSLEPEQQDHWLDQAIAHRWSVADLRLMLRLERREKQEMAGRAGTPPAAPALSSSSLDPLPPATEVVATEVRCPNCGSPVPLST